MNAHSHDFNLEIPRDKSSWLRAINTAPPAGAALAEQHLAEPQRANALSLVLLAAESPLKGLSRASHTLRA
jgi:hypothetical protein